MTRTTAIAAAALALAGALSMPATGVLAQNSILNIGPPPNIGGPGGPPSGGCFAMTLTGSTFVRVCGPGYTAQLGGTYCNGGVSSGWNNSYRLSAGGCNNGQQFLGGSLACNGPACSWTPSAAGFAAGFRPETVYIQYQ